MHPRVPLARKTASALVASPRSRDSFVCPSCSLWRLAHPTVALPKGKSKTGSAYPRLTRALHTTTVTTTRSKATCGAASSSRTTLPVSVGSAAAGTRHATTLASRTAINSPSNVPDANRGLYASIERLKDIASDYVNQSRLQLALRGLEADCPTIRIGLLGLGSGGLDAARKLASVLLTDALADEAQWERILRSDKTNNGKPVLLRYGAEDDIPPLNPLVDTICIPSAFLHQHNLEFLITSYNTSSVPLGVDPAGLADAMLVPPLQTPVASTGRTGFVRYPVHKAILVGEGIEGCMDFGRLATVVESTILGQTGAKEKLIQVVLSVPRQGPTRAESQLHSDVIFPLDIPQAADAIDLFRQDVANGPVFTAKWQASNIESIKKALSSDTADRVDEAAIPVLRPVLEHHVRSTLDSTSAAIVTAEVMARSAQLNKTIPDQTRTSIQNAISTWSQHAHTDLQVSLATALASRSWRRTSWSRLLWRVDDVGVAAEGVLRNHWLLDAEAGLAFLAGRVEQAGFFRTSNAQANFNPSYTLHSDDSVIDAAKGEAMATERAYLSTEAAAAPTLAAPTKSTLSSRLRNLFSKQVREPTPADLLQTEKVVARVTEHGGIDIFHSRPWPLAIHFTRQKLLHTLVPALQSRAQTLLLSTLSTMGGTSALGAWVFFATGGTGLFEGGAVAALGLVWSLRRLQKKWEEARRVWEGEVREGGRVVLAEVEETMRKVVRENERAELRVEDVQHWSVAREAVKDVREALEQRVSH
ncbi:hypothetical protein AAFC00_003227 [Neodothiora populina]|uniref:Mmc1 C-terminal domain-containing protein n=1 Tax=Neodothiora populina TaxID=2781224 RepID=A0ABR3PA20_9PEZI